MISRQNLAASIDHALLKPEISIKEVIQGCQIAESYKVASVCVRPVDVSLAASCLKDSDVLTGTVIGFPNGDLTTKTKCLQAKEALEDGAAELDVVLNISRLISEEYDIVSDDLHAVAAICRQNKAKIKIIFENCYLSEEQIKKACQICNAISPDWIKTSTGFGLYGARAQDIVIMKNFILPHIQIKASGGIRTLEQATKMLSLGCTRIGTASTKAILDSLG